MKKTIIILPLILFLTSQGFSQTRPVNTLNLQNSYSYSKIHKSLRDLVDQAERSSYFDDAFFNALLKKIVSDKQFSEKEKVQIFYLMQKKLSFAFVGVAYLPPKQNYFNFFMGESITWQKTALNLKELHYDVTGLLALVSSEQKSDPVVASNALLLATILNPDSSLSKLEYYSRAELIAEFENPDIFNHHLCLSAAIKQNEIIATNLASNILNFKKEMQIEDALCALYTKNNPVGTIKDYILQEQNVENDLAIETALCALQNKVPQATFEKSLKNFIDECNEKWKKELLKKILGNKIPFNYSLADKEQIVNKVWEEVTLSLYTDGALITDKNLMEFDPN